MAKKKKKKRFTTQIRFLHESGLLPLIEKSKGCMILIAQVNSNLRDSDTPPQFGAKLQTADLQLSQAIDKLRDLLEVVEG